jgi:uncharacterized membrane protein YdjX (TVP38/TMEM64 family)
MARLRTSSAATVRAGARRWWLWAGLALAVAALCALPFILPVGEWLEQAERWILARGLWGVALFVGLFVAATLVLAPDWPLAVGAGLVYGLWAFPVVLGAAMVAASLAFLASRHLLRERVRAWLARRPRLAAIDRAVGEEGWKIVLLLRLSPLVPFNLQNYVFGATAIPFSHYLAASLAGIAPGTALFVYLGSLGRAARAGRDAGGAVEWVFLGVGLAATIAAILLVARKATARLAAADIDPEH